MQENVSTQSEIDVIITGVKSSSIGLVKCKQFLFLIGHPHEQHGLHQATELNPGAREV
jgi:hypothetical protein